MPIRGILFDGCYARAIVDPNAVAADATRKARRFIRSSLEMLWSYAPEGDEEIQETRGQIAASLSRTAHRSRAGRQEPVEYLPRSLGERAVPRAVEYFD